MAPSIVNYYYQAAMMEHILQWTNPPNTGVDTSNWTVKILVKFWRKNYQKVMPGLSPLASFLWHSLFKEVIKLDNLGDWKLAGRTQFFKLGKRLLGGSPGLSTSTGKYEV